MDRFDFLDTETGLGYCAEDEEIYLEVLEEYANEDRRDELNKYLAEGNLADYRVVAHSIKSTSLTIGAVKLSEKAKEFEFAAADENMDFIKEGHQAFVDEYSDILDKIKKALAE